MGKSIGIRASVDGQCPLCGEARFRKLVWSKPPHPQRFYSCERCRLVRMVTETAFRRDYWDDEALTLHVYSNNRVRAELRARYERYLPLVTALCGGAGSLLDAGCGIGNFLLAAREARWKVAGVEVSEKAAAIARSHGLEVETASLEESRLPAGTFDAVTLWDVLAQLEAPVKAMRVVRDKLRPGGIVFLETPNEGFWLRSVFRKAFDVSRGRIDLLQYFYYPDHKFYFTVETLTRLLETAGFRDVRVWQDVTSPSKARLKIAPGKFPLRGVVLPLLPVALGLMRRFGIGNKLIATARKA